MGDRYSAELHEIEQYLTDEERSKSSRSMKWPGFNGYIRYAANIARVQKPIEWLTYFAAVWHFPSNPKRRRRHYPNVIASAPVTIDLLCGARRAPLQFSN